MAFARSDVARNTRDLSDDAADRREGVARSERHGARDAHVCARVGQLVGRARGHVRHGADGRLAPAARRRAAARAAFVEFAYVRLADARPRGPHHQPRGAARALRDARELRAAARWQAVSRRRAAEPRRSRALLFPLSILPPHLMLVPHTYSYMNISLFWRLDRLRNSARLRGHAAVRGTARRIASAARVVRANASLCGEARRLRAAHSTQSSSAKDWLVVTGE